MPGFDFAKAEAEVPEPPQQKSGFDFERAEQEAPGPTISGGETAARGMAQTATWGMLNPLLATVLHPQEAAKMAFGTETTAPPGEAIAEAQRKQLRRAEAMSRGDVVGPEVTIPDLPQNRVTGELAEQEQKEAAGAKEHPAIFYAAMLGPSLFSLLRNASRVGLSKILPSLRGTEAELAEKIGTRYAKPLVQEARSARGAAGAAVAQGSRDIERLGMEQGLGPEAIAANKEALATDEANQLAESLAAKTRERLPEDLKHIESSDALAKAAEEEATKAQAYGETPEYAANLLKGRAKAQLKRYAIPAGAALYGYLSGEEGKDSFERGALGGTLGLLLASGRVSPALRALGPNLAYSPEMKRLVAGKAANAIERVIAAGQSQGGRGAAIARTLITAGQRSPETQAVYHYVMQRDPDYQQLMRAEVTEGMAP